MIQAHRITTESVDALRGLYERFCQKAVSEYRWAHEPIAFEALVQSLSRDLVRGYWVEDTAISEPVALMLYRLETHRAIEINLIYVEVDDLKTVTDRLIRRFIADNRETEGWDVVSYAMLGPQGVLVRTLPWYGFKPIGQAQFCLDLTDSISLQIFQQQAFEPLEAGYQLDGWQPHYAGAVAECIHEAFQNAVDSLWDPRFRTLIGARQVVGLMTAGMMGQFLPTCTSILLKDGQPVGFCFLLQDSLMEAHIPLIGIKPDQRRKKLGSQLLKDCIARTVQDMVSEKNNILRIKATTDTDNIRAIKMYRRLGFREEYNYPHVYLPREKLRAFQPGKWC
jgi:ribosomal protein S18 acetylase RimI-like enzyme